MALSVRSSQPWRCRCGAADHGAVGAEQPTMALSVVAAFGGVAWRRRAQGLALGLWFGGVGVAGLLALPFAFALSMTNSSL